MNKSKKESWAIPLRLSVVWLACIACLAKQGFAIPDVTAAEARAFLGGRTGKVVYLKNYNSQLYYIDLSDSLLRERSVAPDQYCNSPMINDDGIRLLYESLGGIYIRNLEENSPSRHTILSAPIRPGYVYEPRWWTDPATGTEYVIYSTGYMEEHAWPQISGQTYIQKIVNNQPSGAATMLLPFVMGGGRSRNGLWGATSNHSTGMFKFVSGKIDSAFYTSQNWMLEGMLLACNPSISTSKDPSRQNRMMHLTSGGTNINGKPYDNHKAIIMRSWNDKSIDDPFWYMGPMGDNCNKDTTGNQFWAFPEWSNDENYFVLTGSKEIDIVDEGDLYFSRINYGTPNRVLRIMKGGSKFYFPFLWIQDGKLPARIHLTKPQLAFSSLLQDSVNPPSQQIAITNTGDGILPVLNIGPVAKWLKVAISGNGTNTPTLTVTVDRDSVLLGEYLDTVSVSFGSGVDSQAFVVTYNLSDIVMTSLKAHPSMAVALPGGLVQLEAVAYDQNGNPMVPQPTLTWSGLGGLDVSVQGLVHADTNVWHASYAIGTIGALRCTTTVWVSRHYIKVDAGADKPASGWQSDSSYAVGTNSIKVNDTAIALFGSKNAAPSLVYQTLRIPAPTYRFSELPNGQYHVRLHFTSPDTGQNNVVEPMSVRVQGVTVLNGYTLPTKTAKGALRGEVKEASVSVANGQGLSISFLGATLPARTAISGIEVYDEGIASILVTSPNGGEKYHLGDTLVLKWQADSMITAVGLQVSMDSGLTWHAIRNKSVSRSDATWTRYPWVIPDSLDGVSLLSNKVLVSVYDYFGADRDRSDLAFSLAVVELNAIRNTNRTQDTPWFIGTSGRGLLWLRLPSTGDYRVSISDLRGHLIASSQMSGAGPRAWEIRGLRAGLYRLQISGPGLVATRLLPMF